MAALAAYAAALLMVGRAEEADAVIEHGRGLDLTAAEAALLEGVVVPPAEEPAAGASQSEAPGESRQG